MAQCSKGNLAVLALSFLAQVSLEQWTILQPMDMSSRTY